MKRLISSFLLLALFLPMVKAQSPDRLKRVRMETLEGFLSVNQGEFQAEYNYLPNMATHSMSAYYNYLFVFCHSLSNVLHLLI